MSQAEIEMRKGYKEEWDRRFPGVACPIKDIESLMQPQIPFEKRRKKIQKALKEGCIDVTLQTDDENIVVDPEMKSIELCASGGTNQHE